MPSVLEVFDYCQTVGVSIALVATIPPAGFVYCTLIFSRQFSARYIFKLIAFNGITGLLNSLTWLIIAQLTSFEFMHGFYVYMQEVGLATPLAAVNALFGDLSLHLAMFIALNRTIVMLSFRNRENDFSFFLCSVIMSFFLTLPAVLDFRFTRSIYLEISIDGESILIPDVIVTNEFYRILSYVIRVVVNLTTLILNAFLCILITRDMHFSSKSQSKRFKAERGLIITSIIAYAAYMVSFANSLIVRYFNIVFCGYAQWLFLGIKSITPFWCLIIFIPSVRRLFGRRQPTTKTTTVQSHTLTA